MTTFFSVVLGIVYIICTFACLFTILLYERVVDKVDPEVLYDGEVVGWIFVASTVWPIVLFGFIACTLWDKVIKKILIALIETLTSKWG